MSNRVTNIAEVYLNLDNSITQLLNISIPGIKVLEETLQVHDLQDM